jgi:hypothetical protein
VSGREQIEIYIGKEGFFVLILFFQHARKLLVTSMISNVLALWLKFEKTKGINEITETLNARTSWLARKLIIKMKTKLQQKKLHHRQRTQNILLQWLL